MRHRQRTRVRRRSRNPKSRSRVARVGLGTVRDKEEEVAPPATHKSSKKQQAHGAAAAAASHHSSGAAAAAPAPVTMGSAPRPEKPHAAFLDSDSEDHGAGGGARRASAAAEASASSSAAAAVGIIGRYPVARSRIGVCTCRMRLHLVEAALNLCLGFEPDCTTCNGQSHAAACARVGQDNRRHVSFDQCWRPIFGADSIAKLLYQHETMTLKVSPTRYTMLPAANDASTQLACRNDNEVRGLEM